MDAVSIALDRFGLGERPNDRKVLGDPRRWVLAQVAASAAYPASLANLSSSKDRQLSVVGVETDERKQRSWMALHEELHARLAVAFTTDTPFAERWVRHFSSHFMVSTRQLTATMFVGPFEREVVRAHAFGKFNDMLLASTQHPAMLNYLDNQRSVGPESAYVERKSRRGQKGGDRNLGEPGLNENLAREVLELHSMGADGGYGQDDVRALANLLTGWKSDNRGEHGGGFFFDTAKEQPGSVTFLGKKYGGGLEEGIRAINDIAAHPSTARNVARRVARHFRVSDPAGIATLETAFRDSGGDLAEVAKALIGLDSCWRGAAVIRNPDDWVTALVRASGGESVFAGGKNAGRLARGTRAKGERKASPKERPDPGSRPKGGGAKEGKDPWNRAMRSLGQPTWGASSPEGWPDDEASWAGPEQLVRRVEVASTLAATLLGASNEAFDHVSGTLVPKMSPAGQKMFERAGDRTTALTLAFCAPETLRR